MGRARRGVWLAASGGALLALLLVTLLGVGLVRARAPGSSTRPESPVRGRHTAILLADGTILVAGGNHHGPLATTERYDPATGTWRSAGRLRQARSEHTATLLPDGRVLVVGGSGTSGRGLATDVAELYDPATNRWSLAARPGRGRVKHTATLLPDGRVLVVGGQGGFGVGQGYFADAEVYDPALDQWRPAAPLSTSRYMHTATRLKDGRVLVVGGVGGPGNLGSDLASQVAEIYDPATDSWHQVVPTSGHLMHTATLLQDGRVLIAGGIDPAELYDPALDRWERISNPRDYRSILTTTLLPSGQVLGIGGTTVALYDPAADRWRPAGTLAVDRTLHTATLLPDGRVVVIGGNENDDPNTTRTVESYTP